MTTITLETAQNDLPALLARALAGEDIVIAMADKLVRLAPCPAGPAGSGEPRPSYRGHGVLKGQLIIGPEFFEPLSDEECGCAEGTDLT